MFTILDMAQPDRLEEAYEILLKRRNNTILGGCAFLKMSKKQIRTGIDLSKLKLDYIREDNGFVAIGAMTTLRELETNPLLRESFNSILSQAVSNIIGVQFRNGVTIGASVYSRYGFSDLLTALLVLDTEVELYHQGRMPLGEFLKRPCQKDILVQLRIKKSQRIAAFISFRKSASDFAVLNVAVSKLDDQWTIAVGARPGRAMIAERASRTLNKENLRAQDIEEAANIAADELSFGTNARGTADYRKALCRVLVKRGIREVILCKSN
ncbi:aerobic-type carbon monoxide dehydrogenase, middle subunit CoxM/CutM-like protein [Desulfosporosinus acidiphilus SJ4]|uniref:Aerobic-type carbon monoxide dehydrogenase, middle subunit CoxM/CutM-like protein n=1 Tax=Desulfosporosinus acidiphilus (strain DSM 22704 / JCM 16185 / SJ4) TaxID=646529 RepID=I4D2N8_DESAJ|nr:FAD binding domain-containing protein [Desulfosporosinus acidiphilus]AFM40062.1 aerobic-type carbon monoxide dehydrogenase, middle subunit CoxM/CutM-like protein [Desulfosporosinus acidiphilus SJ4]